MGGTGDYQDTAEASNRWRTYPNNFLYSGRWGGSAAADRGVEGFYWSRTANSSSLASGLRFESESVSPLGISFGKSNGNTVRCLTQ